MALNVRHARSISYNPPSVLQTLGFPIGVGGWVNKTPGATADIAAAHDSPTRQADNSACLGTRRFDQP